MLEVRSVTDKKGLIRLLVVILLTFCLFAAILLTTGMLAKAREGSFIHLTMSISLAVAIIGLTLYTIQKTLTAFVITDQELRIERWFGLQQKTYSLLPGTPWEKKWHNIPTESRSALMPKRYFEYHALYIHTIEGETVRIDSRQIDNLEELEAAVKRAVRQRS